MYCMSEEQIKDMYSIFMIDPPWPQKKGGLRTVRKNQGNVLVYQTMPLDNIFLLLDKEVFPQGSSNHTVFLWTIDKFLVDADKYMLSRGYKRHIRLVWNKTNGIAPAFTVRFCHEYLVWYYKSPMMKIDSGMRGKYGSIITEKSRQHSRKPDAAYDFVKSIYPNSHRIDVFSRERRDGWDSWGNELDYFDSTNVLLISP